MKFKQALLILVLLLFAAPAWTQQAAALSGAVQDSTGAVLPGVTVKLTSKAQGIVRQHVIGEFLKSGGDGCLKQATTVLLPPI
jgi:hypothetical protein